jgi:3-deoxy-7-phosphoheptulonate synthase
MVPDMAVAAAAAGADGLIVEVHPDPSTALSDGYQSLTFDEFETTMKRCNAVVDALRAVGV